MIWLGIALVVLGAILIFLSRRSADKVLYMKATETKTVGEVVTLVNELQTELGGGATGYAEYVEFKGKVACDEPLVGEFSDQPAAIVHSRVEREYEQRVEELTDYANNNLKHASV